MYCELSFHRHAMSSFNYYQAAQSPKGAQKKKHPIDGRSIGCCGLITPSYHERIIMSYNSTVLSASTQPLCAESLDLPDFSQENSPQASFEARQRRDASRWLFNKMRRRAYQLARQTDDGKQFERAVLGMAEQMPGELPKSTEAHVTPDDCRATAIQIIEWVWPRSGTWRHPDKRHLFTREQARLGGQRSRPTNRVDDDKRQQAIQLRADGWSRRAVAQHLGISERSVTRFCCASNGTGTQLGGAGGSLSAVQENNTPLPPKRLPVPSAEEGPSPAPEPAAPPPKEPSNGRPRLPERQNQYTPTEKDRGWMTTKLARQATLLRFSPERVQKMHTWATSASVGELWSAIVKAERRIQGGKP